MPGAADGRFSIWSEDKLIKFTSYFGDGPAIVTEGYAGWQVVSRPREVGITVWQGRNPMAIEIPFMLDFLSLWNRKYSDDAGVKCEDRVTNLEKLCGIGGHAQPAICYVDGGGMIPHDYTTYQGHRWVIEQVSWDKQLEVRSKYSGRRLRCGGVITIRQYMTASEILQRIGPKDRAAKPRYHVIKRKETLEKIALQFYGDANKWKKIADANHMRDPRSLTIGKRIRIP